MKCTICKTGHTHPGITTVTLQRDNTVVVIRDVPAEICEDCGEYYLSDTIARRVYADADETAHRIRLVARRFLALEIESWGYVLFDPSVGRAVRLQQPVVTAFPRSPAAIAFRALAERLWDPPDPESFRRPLATQKLEA